MGSQSRGPSPALPPPTPGADQLGGSWRGWAGGSGEHTNLPQLPVVDQLGPVSVDQGTEAEAVLPAARGEVVGGGQRVSGAKHSGQSAKQGFPFFPEMNPQPLGAGVGRTKGGKEPACCHNPRHRVKAPWGSASCHIPPKPPTKVWGPRLLCFRAPGWNSPDTLLRGLQEHQPKMYQAAAGIERASKGDAPFPEKRLFPQRSVFCSRAETDPAQGAQGTLGEAAWLLQEPLSPLPRTLCGSSGCSHSCKGLSFSDTTREALPSLKSL